MKNINFKINDFSCNINNKLTLIQACLKNKIDVPRFCFHEKLSIAGNCRMCLVEDLKQIKPIASCAVNVSPSMVIYTNTIKVKKSRESVLEFLLANHPLDCPICDQGGECDLQDQSMVFGSDRGRFYEFKRAVEDKDCGPLIKTIMNRCIHCTRRVRFSNEVAGINIMGITGRGSKMEIGFYIENLVRSELSGNVIDLCPVGALTSKPFAFTSRPWELKSFNSIDVLDEMHSNIRVDVRGTKIMRILPRFNDLVNQDWISDKIRFSYDSFRSQRLLDPIFKFSSSYIKISWKSAIFLLKNVYANFFKKLNVFHSNFYLGDFIDLETLYMVRKFSHLMSFSSFHFQSPKISVDFNLMNGFNTPFSRITEADCCLVFGFNLRLVFPILNSLLRQSVAKNNLNVYLISYCSNFNYFLKHVSTSSIALLDFLEGNSWLSTRFSKKFSLKPLFYLNGNIINTQFISHLNNFSNIFKDDWVGLNVLNASSYTLNELNFYSVNSNPYIFTQGLNFFLNYDKPTALNYFNIYQGHHGDWGSLNSNLILPSRSFIEKNSGYVNISGLFQKTRKILFAPGNSREDWKILNAFIQVFDLSNSFFVSKSFELNNLASKLTPLTYHHYSYKFFQLTWKNFVNFPIFSLKSIENNFYLSNIITKSSKIMSLCHSRFKIKSYNFH